MYGKNNIWVKTGIHICALNTHYTPSKGPAKCPVTTPLKPSNIQCATRSLK